VCNRISGYRTIGFAMSIESIRTDWLKLMKYTPGMRFEKIVRHLTSQQVGE